jgi:hypothetical protein
MISAAVAAQAPSTLVIEKITRMAPDVHAPTKNAAIAPSIPARAFRPSHDAFFLVGVSTFNQDVGKKKRSIPAGPDGCDELLSTVVCIVTSTLPLDQ